MIVEMIHTSAPAGLHGRHGGFTVVAATRGAPPPLLALLEPLSALELGPADREDPGSLALRRLRSGSSDWALLTRVLPCGVDHTGRRNRLAHHLAFDEESQRVERPADWILGFPFLDRWEEPPHELEEPRRPGPSDHGNPWGDAVGDAGWIDAILERCRAVTDVPITVLLPAGSDLRRLAGTLLARVESPATWRIGFATRWERSRARSSTRLRLLREDDPVWPRESIRPGPTLLDLRSRPPAPRPARTPTPPLIVANAPAGLPRIPEPARGVPAAEAPWSTPDRRSIEEDLAEPPTYEFHDPGRGLRRGLLVLILSSALGAGIGVVLDLLGVVGAAP